MTGFTRQDAHGVTGLESGHGATGRTQEGPTA